MPKKVLIALPPSMLEQVDFVAQVEHRTRSDLIREALRRYLDNFRRQQGNHLSVSTMDLSENYASAKREPEPIRPEPVSIESARPAPVEPVSRGQMPDSEVPWARPVRTTRIG